MSLEMQLRAMPDVLDSETGNETDNIWLENLVAGAGVAIAVLFVSSLAVVMYMA